jgi:GDP-L-fucose synthase
MVGKNILEHPIADRYEFIAPSRMELDLTNAVATQLYIRKAQPDIIIHAAGRVGGIQANIAYPVEFLVTNMDIGRNVILSAYNAGVPRLINLASSCMYPRNAPNPLNEGLILQGELEPTNEGYAIAKIFATRLCEYINRESKQSGTAAVRYKTLIPCNLFGRHDKFEPEHSHLIPAIIHKIHQAKMQNLGTVNIWGDGKARREFMCAGDLAAAVLQAIEDFNELPDLINIGMGHDYSVTDYYTAVAQVIGWKGRFIYDNSQPVGMKQKLVDVTRQRSWGWKPNIDLSEGIKQAYDYYLNEQKGQWE